MLWWIGGLFALWLTHHADFPSHLPVPFGHVAHTRSARLPVGEGGGNEVAVQQLLVDDTASLVLLKMWDDVWDVIPAFIKEAGSYGKIRAGVGAHVIGFVIRFK